MSMIPTRRYSRLPLGLSALLMLSLAGAAAAGDCEPQWDGAVGQPGFNNEHAIRALATYNGELYAVGDFRTPSSAGDYVARWDGSSWQPVGSGFGVIGEQWCCNLYALAVFDGHLYAGGVFKSADGKPAESLARWDGTEWHPVPGEGQGVQWSSINVGGVEALTVFDDGTGPALYIGGWFDMAGDVPAMSIVKWDGENFTPLGVGVGGTSPFPRVRSLGVFDDGNGPALYAGGNFITAGGLTVNRIAKWDGQQWHALGSGANNLVLAFTTWDDGNGEALYVGGAFSNIGGISASRIARFDGTSFSSVGGGITGGESSAVLALDTYDDGTGEGSALYAGGFFTHMGGVATNHIARWNGSQWQMLGLGVVHTDPFIAARVNALAAHDDGSGTGRQLMVAGLFNNANDAGGGTAANNVVAWGGCADPQPPCVGDINGDGVVDVSDLLALLEAWGTCPEVPGPGPCVGYCGGPGPDGPSGCWCDEGCFGFGDCCDNVCFDCPALIGCNGGGDFSCPADLNSDGVVDVFDLLTLLGNWGACP